MDKSLPIESEIESRFNYSDITTESIKYAGSKLKLIPYILSLAKRTDAKTIFDGFSGTTRVSQAFAKLGYTVLANDHSKWSEVFGNCYLNCKSDHRTLRELIDHLNGLTPEDGWFTDNYGGEPTTAIGQDGNKKPWQRHNTKKLDAIRNEIDRLALADDLRNVAITSLILALDQVDNTLGHYASYLREWSPRSYKSMKLEIPQIIQSDMPHRIFRSDTCSLIHSISADLAYFDPPYGSNNEKMPPSRVRYTSYYHIWTTIINNDRPELFGKSNRRVDSSDKAGVSVFEEYRKGESGRFLAVEAIDRLISDVKARWVMLSYSSGGRATANELIEVIQNNGKLLEVLEINYKKNVMASMKWTNEWIKEAEESNREFLFLLEK